MVGDKLRGALILLAALAFIACADGTTTTTDDAGTTPGETTPGVATIRLISGLLSMRIFDRCSTSTACVVIPKGDKAD